MSRFWRGSVGIVTVALVLVAAAAPSYAGGPLGPNDPVDSGGGIPGVFVFLFVVGAVFSVGVAVWKVSTAQKLAKQSGMDPGLATQMTLLTENGLDATYLASSLRLPPVAPAAATPEPTTGAAHGQDHPAVAGRLTELKSLLDQGLITRAEYDERRQEIIDTV